MANRVATRPVSRVGLHHGMFGEFTKRDEIVVQKPQALRRYGVNQAADVKPTMVQRTQETGLANYRSGTFIKKCGKMDRIDLSGKPAFSRTKNAARGSTGFIYHTIKRTAVTAVNMAASSGDVAEGLSKIRTGRNVASPGITLVNSTLRSGISLAGAGTSMTGSMVAKLTTSKRAAQKLDFLDKLAKGDRGGAMNMALKKTMSKIDKTNKLIEDLKKQGKGVSKSMDAAQETLKRLNMQKVNLEHKWGSFADKFQNGSVGLKGLKDKAQDIRGLQHARHQTKLLGKNKNMKFDNTKTGTTRWLSRTRREALSNNIGQHMTNLKMRAGNRVIKMSNRMNGTGRLSRPAQAGLGAFGMKLQNAADLKSISRMEKHQGFLEHTSVANGLNRNEMKIAIKDNKRFIKLHKKDKDIKAVAKLDKKLTKKAGKATRKQKAAKNKAKKSKKTMTKGVRSAATGSVKMVFSLCTSQISGEAMQGFQQMSKFSKPLVKGGKFGLKTAKGAIKGTSNFAVKKLTKKSIGDWAKLARKKILKTTGNTIKTTAKVTTKVAAVPVKFAAKKVGQTAVGQSISATTKAVKKTTKTAAKAAKKATAQTVQTAKNMVGNVTSKLKDAVKKALKAVGNLIAKAFLFIAQGIATFILSHMVLCAALGIVGALIFIPFIAGSGSKPGYAKDPKASPGAQSESQGYGYMGDIPKTLTEYTATLENQLKNIYDANYKGKKYSIYGNAPVEGFITRYYSDKEGNSQYPGTFVKDNYKELFAELTIWAMRDGGTLDDKSDAEIKAHLKDMYDKTHAIIRRDFTDGSGCLCEKATAGDVLKSVYTTSVTTEPDYDNQYSVPVLDADGNPVVTQQQVYRYKDDNGNVLSPPEVTTIEVQVTYIVTPTKEVTVTKEAEKTEDSGKEHLYVRIDMFIDKSEATFTAGMTPKEIELYRMYASDAYDLGFYTDADMSELGYEDYDPSINNGFRQGQLVINGDKVEKVSGSASFDLTNMRKSVVSASSAVDKTKAIGKILKTAFIPTKSTKSSVPYTGSTQTESKTNYTIETTEPQFPLAPLPSDGNGHVDGTKSSLENGVDGPGFIWRLYTEGMPKEIQTAYGGYATYDEILDRANNGTYTKVTSPVPGDLCVKVNSSGQRVSPVYVLYKDYIEVTPAAGEDWTGSKLTGAPGVTEDDGQVFYGYAYGSNITKIDNPGSGYKWVYIRVFK